MTDREERQHVIEVLQNMVDWMQEIDDIATPERIHALFYAIASIKTDLKYDLLYEETSGQADKPTAKNDCETCIHNKGVLECDMYGCKYESTTKNDLAVDWESYKDVDGNSLDDLILEVLQNNFDCGNTYGYKVADEIIGLLPSVTPQEPQSFKWCDTCKEYDQEKHCCHRYSKVIRDTVAEIEQEPRWIDVNERLPKDGGTFIISYEEIMASGYVFRGVESMGLVHGEGMEWIDNLGRRFESNYRKVKAWMPLPESYEAESEDKE